MGEIEREECTTCIIKEGFPVKKSWCGRRVGMEFHFIDVYHAIMNAENQGRLIACPDCTEAINKKA